MGRTRWEQIKRYLKIPNFVEDEKFDTRSLNCWKKQEPLATEFRINLRKYWIRESHVSIDEQFDHVQRKKLLYNANS